MSRNKYPEETYNLIIEVSTKLFLEKGYEHTTVQDIINNLGGLSKGAIYHHFKSKEDILIAASDKLFNDNALSKKWTTTKFDTTLSGSEKIKKMLIDSIDDPQEQQFRAFGIDLKKVPYMLSDLLVRSVLQIAPKVFQPVIEQGIADGSIKTSFPKELAELIALLANIWLNPLVFRMSDKELRRKFNVIRDMTLALGFDIEDIYQSLEEMNKKINNKTI